MVTMADVPDRSLAQRREAIKRANWTRSRRAVLKRDIHARRESGVFILLVPPDYVLTMKVFDRILAMPNYGRTKTGTVLHRCRISPTKTIGGLSAPAPRACRIPEVTSMSLGGAAFTAATTRRTARTGCRHARTAAGDHRARPGRNTSPRQRLDGGIRNNAKVFRRYTEELARIRTEYTRSACTPRSGTSPPITSTTAADSRSVELARPACDCPRRADKAQSSQQDMTTPESTDRACLPLGKRGRS
jgi:hypothetical protein